MKKIFLSVICMFLIIAMAGCAKKGDINLEKLSEKIDELKGDNIDIQSIYPEDMGVFGELDFIYDFDFKDKIGLDSDLLEDEYKAYYNEENKELLLALRPKKNKDEQVKNQLENLKEKYDAEIYEIDGLLFYISSNDNDKVKSMINESKPNIFSSLEEIKKEDLLDRVGINPENIDEIVMKIPMMLIDSNSYVVVKAKSGKEESVKKEFEQYFKNLEEQWSMYLPDQYELVKNRKETKVGDYLVYIISQDNQKVLEAMMD